MAKVHKGWLKTREGDYFSPNTLAESLYSREGIKYDDVVKGYVQNAKIELETTQMTVSQKVDDLYERLKNFDGSDSNTFYIVDSDGNIILKVDDTGVHSINFTTSEYDINATLTNLDARIVQEIKDRESADNSMKEYVDNTAQTIQQSLTQTDNKVNTLIGDDPDKSVRTIANEELAAQLLSGKADADFKTLQQLAAWLEDHPEDVSAINLAIQVIQGQLGGFDETTNAVKNYIDNAINTLQQDMNDRLKNFDGSDSDTLYIVDSNNYKIAQIDKDGVRSINFISNEYDMNAELKSLGERIDTEASTRATQDEIYYNKHKDELDTHTVWDTEQHTALQNNINDNRQFAANARQELLDKIKFYENEGVEGSDTLYIVDGNGYKLAQFDKDGITTTFVKATDFTAGNGFTLSGAMFYNLQGSINTFPDGI